MKARRGRIRWIHGCNRVNRGFRKSGGGVVEAFNDGYERLNCDDWDYIVKLDGDLSFDPGYFEKCFEYFDGGMRSLESPEDRFTT